MSERLDDGYQTLISFASDPDVVFYEKTVTPPGVDGGGEIETTLMENTTWRTKAPKSLLTLSNASMSVAYDPAAYSEIIALCNVNNLITVTFPDGSTVAFYGYLNTFTPGENSEGEQPLADIEIIPTLRDAAGAETAPVVTPAA